MVVVMFAWPLHAWTWTIEPKLIASEPKVSEVVEAQLAQVSGLAILEVAPAQHRPVHGCCRIADLRDDTLATMAEELNQDTTEQLLRERLGPADDLQAGGSAPCGGGSSSRRRSHPLLSPRCRLRGRDPEALARVAAEPVVVVAEAGSTS